MHYDRVAAGQWTFYPTTTHQMIIFRKGSQYDPVQVPGMHTADEGSDDWLVGSSEWGWTNDGPLGRMLDLMNQSEAEQDHFADACKSMDDPVHDWYSEEQP